MELREYSFKKARGFGVAKEKLEHEREVSKRRKELKKLLERVVKESPAKKLWSGPFIYPVDFQRISTPFGEIRTTLEKGRYHHAALDLVGTPKSVIWASQAGKVVIKDRFLFSGNTVVLDHGCGVMTLYYHLDDFADIQVGDFLLKGNPLGRQGKTGYANGEHLHWEFRVQNKCVDPLQWTQKTF